MLILAQRDPENAENHKYEPRIRIAAAQVLLTMSRQNQTHAKDQAAHGTDALTADEERSRLLAIARRLGAGAFAAELGAELAKHGIRLLAGADDDAAYSGDAG